MRETRSYGSVRGVPGDRHPYRDFWHTEDRPRGDPVHVAIVEVGSFEHRFNQLGALKIRATQVRVAKDRAPEVRVH